MGEIQIDCQALAKTLILLVGNVENIIDITHCMTRLTFFLRDQKRADAKAIENLAGVEQAVFSDYHLEVVMGLPAVEVYRALRRELERIEVKTFAIITARRKHPEKTIPPRVFFVLIPLIFWCTPLYSSVADLVIDNPPLLSLFFMCFVVLRIGSPSFSIYMGSSLKRGESEKKPAPSLE